MKRFLHSLKFNILLPVILITLINTLLITVLVTGVYTQAILRQESKSTQSQFSIINNALDETLNTAQKAAFTAMLDDNIASYVSNNFNQRSDVIHARSKALEIIRGIIAQHSDVYGVLFMREDHSLFGAVKYRNYFIDEPTDIIFTPEMLNQIDALGTNPVWLGPISGSELYAIGIASEKYPQNIVACVRKINYERYGKGYIITLIESTMISEYLSLLADNGSDTYLVTSGGEVITQAGTGDHISDESIAMIFNSQNSSKIIRNPNNHSMCIFTIPMEQYGWFLVKEIPMQYYDQTVRQLRALVWGGALAILIVSLLFYFRWIRRFMNTFTTLKEGILRVQEGYINATIDREFAIDEFEEIRQEFNAMNMTLAGMMENTRELERAQLELEMRNLRTQISPHMVFNSLTAIRWYAIRTGSVQISDMLAELSEMLRPVLREWHTMWTFREEIDHLRHYANLLEIRFGNRFRMDLDIPDGMEDLQLPRFSLQPLVENACEHGSIPNEEMCVAIRVREEDGFVRINVWNNGRMITDEEIRRINETFHSGVTGQHIGLYNVFKRVRMCMGEESGIDIRRPEKGGTDICIWWKKQE